MSAVRARFFLWVAEGTRASSSEWTRGRFEKDLRLDEDDGCHCQRWGRGRMGGSDGTCECASPPGIFNDMPSGESPQLLDCPCHKTCTNKRAHRPPRRRDALPTCVASTMHIQVVCEHRRVDASCDGACARPRVPHGRDDQRLPDDPLKAPAQAAHPARASPQHPPRPRRVPLPVLRASLLPLSTRHPLPKL